MGCIKIEVTILSTQLDNGSEDRTYNVSVYIPAHIGICKLVYKTAREIVTPSPPPVVSVLASDMKKYLKRFSLSHR